jgi:hypothetical protein
MPSKINQIRYCKETSLSSMQVMPSKIIFMNIIEGKNFGEFLDILPSPFAPLKNQFNFKICYL